VSTWRLDDDDWDVSCDDPATLDAIGKASEALEYVERARGHLYAFHQLIGRADFLFEESAVRLAQAGHRDEAASLWRTLVGRDVLEGRWTFEIVERFDDDVPRGRSLSPTAISTGAQRVISEVPSSGNEPAGSARQGGRAANRDRQNDQRFGASPHGGCGVRDGVGQARPPCRLAR
jgi:hypothetical protein